MTLSSIKDITLQMGPFHVESKYAYTRRSNVPSCPKSSGYPDLRPAQPRSRKTSGSSSKKPKKRGRSPKTSVRDIMQRSISTNLVRKFTLFFFFDRGKSIFWVVQLSQGSRIIEVNPEIKIGIILTFRIVHLRSWKRRFFWRRKNRSGV